MTAPPIDWIPVKKRLPLCGQTVLTLTSDEIFSAALNSGSQGKYWIRAPWCTRVGPESAITHWAVYPELPFEYKSQDCDLSGENP